MHIYVEDGIYRFGIFPHDAVPAMLRPSADDPNEPHRDEGTLALAFQPEVSEWLEENLPGRYSLFVIPDFIEVRIPDQTDATAFKLRWHGSYQAQEIYAIDWDSMFWADDVTYETKSTDLTMTLCYANFEPSKP